MTSISNIQSRRILPKFETSISLLRLKWNMNYKLKRGSLRIRTKIRVENIHKSSEKLDSLLFEDRTLVWSCTRNFLRSMVPVDGRYVMVASRTFSRLPINLTRISAQSFLINFDAAHSLLLLSHQKLE